MDALLKYLKDIQYNPLTGEFDVGRDEVYSQRRSELEEASARGLLDEIRGIWLRDEPMD